MTVKATRIGLALMLGSLAAIPAPGQDVFQFRADAAGGVAQGGVSVIALDPVSIGATVADAPYSAEGITEVTQTLADGNRIERRTTATIARASDGRTRREQQGFAIQGRERRERGVDARARFPGDRRLEGRHSGRA